MIRTHDFGSSIKPSICTICACKHPTKSWLPFLMLVRCRKEKRCTAIQLSQFHVSVFDICTTYIHCILFGSPSDHVEQHEPRDRQRLNISHPWNRVRLYFTCDNDATFQFSRLGVSDLCAEPRQRTWYSCIRSIHMHVLIGFRNACFVYILCQSLSDWCRDRERAADQAQRSLENNICWTFVINIIFIIVPTQHMPACAFCTPCCCPPGWDIAFLVCDRKIERIILINICCICCTGSLMSRLFQSKSRAR